MAHDFYYLYIYVIGIGWGVANFNYFVQDQLMITFILD